MNVLRVEKNRSRLRELLHGSCEYFLTRRLHLSVSNKFELACFKIKLTSSDVPILSLVGFSPKVESVVDQLQREVVLTGQMQCQRKQTIFEDKLLPAPHVVRLS